MEIESSEQYKVFIATDPAYKTFLDGYLACLSLQNRLNHHGPEKVTMGLIREVADGSLGFLLRRNAGLDVSGLELLSSFFTAVTKSKKFRSKNPNDQILIYDCFAREYDNTKETESLLIRLDSEILPVDDDLLPTNVLVYKENRGVLTNEPKTSREEIEEKLEYRLD